MALKWYFLKLSRHLQNCPLYPTVHITPPYPSLISLFISKQIISMQSSTYNQQPQLPVEISEKIISNLTTNKDLKAISSSSRLFWQVARPLRWREPQFRHHVNLEVLRQIALSMPPIIKVLKLSQFDDRLFRSNDIDDEIDELVAFLLERFKLVSFHMDARYELAPAFWHFVAPAFIPTRDGYITKYSQIEMFFRLPVDIIHTCLIPKVTFEQERDASLVQKIIKLLLEMEHCPNKHCPNIVVDSSFFDRLGDGDWSKLPALPVYSYYNNALGKLFEFCDEDD